ncbi:MAG TPA: hypothetical protein VNC22_08865, partial [Sporichthya sp.]|nr:hypothetical protein [Sporichthya sp.]
MTRETTICIEKLTLTALAVAGIAFVGVRLARADKMMPKATPPAEATRLWNAMAGTWSGKDLAVQMGPQAIKATAKVSCEKAVGGWALRCRVRVQTPAMAIDEEDIFGWDADAGEFHMYTANSMGDTHDHKGRLQGDTLDLEYASTKQGKPYVEKLAFTLKGAN